ncbi:MAG: hypothetical protein KKC11_08520 [Candidatus Omnitrophica bacterium]|nr:hypothetical protein [Candidatus Omnitrophota bacterium]MBU0878685.1 hypothetical protein [Candidatus Omnitrophota bacterium]MBU0896270.1 hypothetical protein [Candidatus Omnitrophota bacterium]MBU1133398.1 hypothetical protein [Candidatus Omnitrophota bacterium]MBU1809629.1 hypothetical protein [Candidatus Omnitrophota bacterium]
MKKPLLLSILILLLLSFSTFANDKLADFNGEWVYEKGERWFLLHLEQQGQKIEGWYSAVVNWSNEWRMRIDGIPEESKNIISGIIKGDTAEVKFKSEWGGTGKAKISHKGNKIKWEIIKGTETGKFYCPQSGALRKKRNLK